jgi:hypothetical protein
MCWGSFQWCEIDFQNSLMNLTCKAFQLHLALVTCMTPLIEVTIIVNQ